MPSCVRQVTPLEYHRPSDLPDGGVLVVGASATGVQLAYEIQLSGRPVTLSVGEHVRGLRLYRGRDIHWWMDRCGVLDERWDEVDDIVRARHVPSMQLAGTPERSTFEGIHEERRRLRARGGEMGLWTAHTPESVGGGGL